MGQKKVAVKTDLENLQSSRLKNWIEIKDGSSGVYVSRTAASVFIDDKVS